MALAVSGDATLGADAPVLVSSVRVGRTVFDYTYTVRATNNGTVALAGVTGGVTSAAATTVVTDGALAFGDLAPGASATTSDTFTIRQDRSAPLAAANLTITLAGTTGPGGPAVGVLLSGADTDRALDRLASMAPLPADPADLAGGFLLTRIDLVLAEDATVGQVNAALGSVGGGIVSMEPGINAVVLAVPRQADGEGLRALAAGLAARPGVAFALPGRELSSRAAPPAPANSPANLRHLQDGGFVAAWNARAAAGDCTANRVPVLVPDSYLIGNGAVFGTQYADWGTQLPGVPVPTQPPGNQRVNLHGFWVLTTLAARTDGRPPTGALLFPECLDIRLIEKSLVTPVSIVHAYSQLMARIEAETPGSGPVILATSLGFPVCTTSDGCDPRDDDQLRATLMSAEDMAATGVVYRRSFARLGERLLVVSAAGNEAAEYMTQVYPGMGVAAYDSPMNIAGTSDLDMPWIRDGALWNPTTPCTAQFCVFTLAASLAEQERFLDTLERIGEDERPAAANVLIVGSVNSGGLNEESAFSDSGAPVFAVGNEIPTLEGTPVNGTSFAAPQVSALAAYLWLLSPELRGRPVTDTLALIKANVCTILCAGLIDAYAAVLSLDSGRALSPADSRIRLALLDVTGDGQFTEADLAEFRDAYRPGGAFVNPIERDDSRHDLNGDGYTGGGHAPTAEGLVYTRAFDPDPEDSPRFGRRVLAIANAEVLGDTVHYDESAVTDSDILCYYAHSPLYTGDPAARYRILYDLCAVGQTYVGTYTETANITTGTQTYTEQQAASFRAVRNEDVTFTATSSASYAYTTVTTRQRLGRLPPCTVTSTVSASGIVDDFYADALSADFSGDVTGTQRITDTCVAAGQPPLVTTRNVDTSVENGVALLAVLDDTGAVVAYEGSSSEGGRAISGRVEVIP